MESINALGRTGLLAAFTASNIASLRSEILMNELCAKVVLDHPFLRGDCSSALTPYRADVAKGEATGVPIYEYKLATFVLIHQYVQNHDAFQRYSFKPRVLVDVSKRSQQTSLFGTTYAAPFGIAPIGISGLLAYRGDVMFAQVGADAAIPAIMSGFSIAPMEEVSAAGGKWFQAYLPGDESKIEHLVDRVKRAGFTTLVITVDIPVSANRENNVRAGFSTPIKPSVQLAWSGIVRPRWLIGTFGRTLLNHGMPHFENLTAERGAPLLSRTAMRDVAGREHLNWEQIAKIRRRWQGPLVLKGILHPEDALKAKQVGVDGIIVSNHGGRQLDGAIAPLLALPAVVDAVGELPVMMDGGVRRGSDVLKAIALGARMVFVGRPFMYAAAALGRAGVDRAVDLLHEDVARNMALLGCTSLSELSTTSVLDVTA